jgi:uncharacterized alkaline shock family protein YloU
MEKKPNTIGSIFIAHRAIASVAYYSALTSYGVVGFAAKNFAEGLTQAIVKDPTLGVEVHQLPGGVVIDLYLIVEYGVRIKEVAASVAESVKYQVEKVTGMVISAVNVHIRGLRVSNTD